MKIKTIFSLLLVKLLFSLFVGQLLFSWLRSSHQRFPMKKDVLRNFTKFTWKHLRPSLLFNKAAGLRPAILLKKRLYRRFFLVNFGKFLRTYFLQNTSGQLLLLICFLVFFTSLIFGKFYLNISILLPLRNAGFDCWFLHSNIHAIFTYITTIPFRNVICQ